MSDMYNTNLDKNNANFTPLSPLSFLKRTAEVYPNKKSIIHGHREYTWQQTYEKLSTCKCLGFKRNRYGRHGFYISI